MGTKKTLKPYKKYVYWLTRDEDLALKKGMKERGVKVREAKGIVCTPLDVINKISSVSPEVWADTCYRQGGWYRKSDKNGLYLIVSSFELDGYESQLSAIITESDFVPPRLASEEEKRALIGKKEFQAMIPPEWLTVEDVEKRIYLRWARRLGSDVKDYEFLYLTHTANHANFVAPEFYVMGQEGVIPYSIDHSAHLCSCCVELFQILGTGFKEKLVAPCPGATIFARLQPDRYLRVKTL